MQFQFKIGWGDGRSRLRRVPVYSMLYWRVSHADEELVTYRPSGRTLADQLGISALAALLLLAVTWLGGWPWSSAASDRKVQQPTDVDLRQAAELKSATDELKRLLPPEKVAELERVEAQRRVEREESLAQLQYERSIFSAVRRGFHWFSFVALAAMAVIPVVALPIQQLVFEKSPQGELVVRKRGLWPSTRKWPISAFTQVNYGAEEDRRRRRRRRYYTIGWRWLVTLRGMPDFTTARQLSPMDELEVAFYIDRQKQQPADADPPPKSVLELCEHLSRLTGATVGKDAIERRGVKRRQIVSSSTPIVTRDVSIPLDELPEGLRRKAKEKLATAGDGKPVVHESVRVTVQDSEGNERTYNSLDELPSDLRADYEQAIRSARARQDR